MLLVLCGDGHVNFLDVSLLQDIFCYEYALNKWSKLSLELPMQDKSFGCVLTSNEKYVMLFGGASHSGIFVLDVMSMKFIKCSLKCSLWLRSTVFCLWFSDEYIHLTKRNANKDFHYKI
eukprot:380151_1